MNSSNGVPLVAIGSSAGAVVVWNVARGIVAARLGGVKGARAAPGGSIRALAQSNTPGHVWAASELTTGAIEYDACDATATSLRALDGKKLPNAHRLLVSGGNDESSAVCFSAGAAGVAVIDIATGAVVGTLAGHSLPITGIALSDDEVRFYRENSC